MSSPTQRPALGGKQRPSQPPPAQGGGDPWAAFGYLVSGVAVYGAIGFGLGRWLHAPFLTAVGIVFGATLGLYLVIKRFGPGAPAPDLESTRGADGLPPRDNFSDTETHREGRGEPAE